MPHVHLPLQSGDDGVLRRMGRRYTADAYARVVARVRDAIPGVAVHGDVIVGFPTEDDAMHAANLLAIRELGVVHGHVFPYSVRAGTPAARMPQVAAPVIRERAAQLRAEVAAVRADWLQSLVGQRLEVLAERDGTGHAPNFARVRLAPGTVPGEIVTVVPARIEEGLLA